MVEHSVETGLSCPRSISEPLAVVRTLQHERIVFCELLAAARLSAPFSVKWVLSALYRMKWDAMWTAALSAVVCTLQYERDAIRTLQRESNTMWAVRLLSYWYLLRWNSSFSKQKKPQVQRGVFAFGLSVPNSLTTILVAEWPWFRLELRDWWFIFELGTRRSTVFFFFVLLSIEHRFVQCVFARTISTRFAKVECSVFRVNRLLPKGKSICTTYGYVTDTSVSKNTHNGIVTLWQVGTNMTITFFFLNYIWTSFNAVCLPPFS